MSVIPIEGVRYWFDSTAQAFLAPGRPSLPLTPPVTTNLSHPGAMYSQAQLDFVKGRLDAKADPWTTAYSNLLGSTAGTGVAYSSALWSPTPQAVVSRGSSGSVGDGDTALQNDLHAALCHALIWVYKGTRANAVKAVQILNAWASTITEIKFDTTSTYSDGKLLAGWTGTVFARAAELMRWTYTPASGEAPLDITNLTRVFNDVWWPRISVGHNGPGFNWFCSFADSMAQIAVFLDDRTKFNAAVAYMRQVTPSLIWMPTDNNPWSWGHPSSITYTDGSVLSTPNGLPIPAQSLPGATIDKSATNPVTFMDSTWFHPLSLPTGLWAETGRDFHHTGMGFAAVSNFAETAYAQGVDFYGENQARLTAAIELFTGFVYATFVSGNTSPAGWPYSKTSSTSSFATSTQRATFETFYHHYVQRLGLSMPNLTAYMSGYARSSPYDVDLHACWETLTTYGTP